MRAQESPEVDPATDSVVEGLPDGNQEDPDEVIDPGEEVTYSEDEGPDSGGVVVNEADDPTDNGVERNDSNNNDESSRQDNRNDFNDDQGSMDANMAPGTSEHEVRC